MTRDAAIKQLQAELVQIKTILSALIALTDYAWDCDNPKSADVKHGIGWIDSEIAFRKREFQTKLDRLKALYKAGTDL